MTGSLLVSVVIPAYNAATTLDETLRSVRSQTHRALEIIVVDDGSTDDTRAVAARHAAVDDRIQVVVQANAGVASARNAGWRRARSDLIAFVDADDLWAPTKIERQLEVLQARGPEVALVYCWYALIDSRSSIIGRYSGPHYEGDVMQQMFSRNFIGNGSSALVRRRALIDAQGFESGLRAAGAEGCEDYLFYCRVAEKHHFAVVPEHLIGYRQQPTNMSSNRPRMLRSWLLASKELLARHPGQEEALERGVRDYGGWLVQQTLDRKGLSQFPLLLSTLFRYRLSIALSVLLIDTTPALIGKIRSRLGRLRRKKPQLVKTETAMRFPIGNAG